MLHITFGNTVLLGFPLIDAIFPETNALLYATLFLLVSSSMVWTLGIYEMTRAIFSFEFVTFFLFFLFSYKRYKNLQKVFLYYSICFCKVC